MNYTQIDVFRDGIRPLIPSAPVPAVDRAIRTAAITISTQSMAIRERITPVNSVKGTGVYTLVPPSDTRIIDIIAARYNNYPMDLTSEKELNIEMPTWDSVEGTPVQIYHSGYNEVTIAPPPDTAVTGGIKVTVALSPTSSAAQVPQELAESFYEALIDGALANLFALPGTSWANPEEAAIRKDRMIQVANEARLFFDERALKRRPGFAQIPGETIVATSK